MGIRGDRRCHRHPILVHHGSNLAGGMGHLAETTWEVAAGKLRPLRLRPPCHAAALSGMRDCCGTGVSPVLTAWK